MSIRTPAFAFTVSVDGSPVGLLKSFAPADDSDEKVRTVMFDSADALDIVPGFMSASVRLESMVVYVENLLWMCRRSRGIYTHFDVATDHVAAAFEKSFFPNVVLVRALEITFKPRRRGRFAGVVRAIRDRLRPRATKA